MRWDEMRWRCILCHAFTLGLCNTCTVLMIWRKQQNKICQCPWHFLITKCQENGIHCIVTVSLMNSPTKKPTTKRMAANSCQLVDKDCATWPSRANTLTMMKTWRRPYVSAKWPVTAAPSPIPAIRQVVIMVEMYWRSQTRSHWKC